MGGGNMYNKCKKCKRSYKNKGCPICGKPYYDHEWDHDMMDPCDMDPCDMDYYDMDPCKKDPCKKNPCKMDPCKKDPCKMDPCKKDPCKKDPCKMDPCKEMCKMPAKCPSKAHLTRMIQEVQFVCIELNLFLDTHPNDKCALRDFNCFSKHLKELIEMYECNFGPLFNFGLSQNPGRWMWNDPLWPWQI